MRYLSGEGGVAMTSRTLPCLLVVTLALITPASGLSEPLETPDCPPKGASIDFAHRIVPGDTLLLCLGDVGLLVRVRTDGTIPPDSFSTFFQYPPRVHATGLTALELREALLTKFRIPVTLVLYVPTS